MPPGTQKLFYYESYFPKHSVKKIPDINHHIDNCITEPTHMNIPVKYW